MGLIGKLFYNYGYWAASRPIDTVFIGLVFATIGCVGLINF